jgi:hypothetical protein
MQKIDAILDLMRTTYPLQEVNGERPDMSFNLSFENGLWHAKAQIRDGRNVVSASAKDKATADEALDAVYRSLVSFNNSVLERIKAKLTRWMGGKPTQVTVKTTK